MRVLLGIVIGLFFGLVGAVGSTIYEYECSSSKTYKGTSFVVWFINVLIYIALSSLSFVAFGVDQPPFIVSIVCFCISVIMSVITCMSGKKEEEELPIVEAKN